MECLLESGPVDQRALQQQLDHSRSAIIRSLESLAEVGWIEDTDEGYQLTPTGRLIITEFRDLLGTVETTESLAPFLDWFPLASYDISVAALSDGEITTVSEGDPLAPVRKQTALLRSTTEFRGLFPSMDIDSMQQVHKRTMDGDLKAEIVVSSACAETIHQEPFAPIVAELLSSGRHTIHIAEGVPLYLGIADGTTVQIGVKDGEGISRALLETTNDSVRSWADSLFSRYRQSAVDELTKL